MHTIIHIQLLYTKLRICRMLSNLNISVLVCLHQQKRSTCNLKRPGDLQWSVLVAATLAISALQWQRARFPGPSHHGWLCKKCVEISNRVDPLLNVEPPKNCKLMTNQIGSTNHSKVGYKICKLSTTPENWWIWLVLPKSFWGRQSLQYPPRNFSPPKWIFTVFDMYEVLVHDQVFKCYILKTWESMISLVKSWIYKPIV